MREIKFRAWDKDEKQWLDIKHFGFDNKELWYVEAIDENEKDIDPPYFIDSDEIELMQYTGLKDKNGREIYEGDILQLGKSEADKGEVDYYKGGWRVKTSPRYHNDDWRTPLWDAVVDEFIVIGNIYENPELLEGDTH